jgi:hypothetical protein
LGIVVEFTYIGDERVENRNLALLPGVHEAYLGSAAHMHGKMYVLDWIEHFRQEWASAVFQDKFPVLVQALRKTLSSDRNMMMLLNRVFERAETCTDNQELADYRRELLGPNGELAPEATLRAIEADTIAYLKDNRTLLPRFYMPNK